MLVDPKQLRTSAPPYAQFRVNCPYCGHNNLMSSKHKTGDTSICDNCNNFFVIGGTVDDY